MNKKALSASLRSVIQQWADKEAQGEAWISTLFPEEGADLMTDAAIAVLEAIEASAKFTESEHRD